MTLMSSSVQSGARKRLLGTLWFTLALVVLVIGFREAIFLSPSDANQGDVGRIFYWHVPSAMLGLVFPYVNVIASFLFLYWRAQKPLSALAADAWAIAAAEVTIVFASIALVTGMLWGRAVWGIWWTWDWRLTSELVLWLLYVAYLMTRRLSNSGESAILGAVIAVFAAIDVPIVYFSIRWFRTQHPSPVFGGGEGSGLDPTMVPAFLWNVLAWLIWSIGILVLRYALERRRQRLDQAAALAALEGSLDPHPYTRTPEPGNAF